MCVREEKICNKPCYQETPTDLIPVPDVDKRQWIKVPLSAPKENAKQGHIKETR